MNATADQGWFWRKWALWKPRWAIGLRYGPALAFKLVEFLTVVGIFWLSCVVGYWLVFGDVANPRHDRMVNLIRLIADNWKAFLLVMIPLFYRSTRTFMDEVQEIWGMKRRTSSPAPLPLQGTNPDRPTAP